MAGTHPDVCVVIATRAREEGLARALEALLAQMLEPERLEVVVVRDGDPPGPVAPAPEGLNVRFEAIEPARGPAAARNEGWRASRAPLIAFTDDDCRPVPEWLESIVERAGPADLIVQGPTEPDPDEAHLLVGLFRTQWHLQPSEWFETCNIAYPRALLEEVEGFDEEFVHSAEDVDLGLRAREAGARRAFEERALVYHAVLPTPLPDALRATVQRDATPMLIARHREHRRQLYMRIFWKPNHAELLLAVAGLLAMRRRPLVGLLVMLPYLDRYVHWPLLLRPRGIARFVVFLGARALIDALEVAVVIRGAVRHRVLIL